MKLKNSSRSGMALVAALIVVLMLSGVGVTFWIRSQNSQHISAADNQRKILTQIGFARLENIRNVLRNDLALRNAEQLESNSFNTEPVNRNIELLGLEGGGSDQAEIQHQVQYVSQGQGTSYREFRIGPNGADQFPVTYDRRSFPKIFNIRVNISSPDHAMHITLSANAEIAPDSLKNYAYLITNEVAPSVGFGSGSFTGRVGIMFNNIANAAINFQNQTDLNFSDVFFTNIDSNHLNYLPTGPTPQFQKGVASSVSDFSADIYGDFQALANQTQTLGGFRSPARTGTDPSWIDSVFVRLGRSSSSDCRMELVHTEFHNELCSDTFHYDMNDPHDSDIPPLGHPCRNFLIDSGTPYLISWALHFYRWNRPLPPQVYFSGSVPDGQIFYADTTNPIRIEPLDPAADYAEICEPKFTFISKQNIEIGASIVRKEGMQETEGNIAFVSLEGASGNQVLPNTKSLVPNHSLQDLKNSGSIDPNQVTLKLEATFIGLSSTSSSLNFDSSLTTTLSTPFHLGSLQTFGGLIGSRFSPSRSADRSGAILAGFDNVNMAFNTGALTSPAPGMSQARTAVLFATLTSLNIQSRSIDEAMAAIR